MPAADASRWSGPRVLPGRAFVFEPSNPRLPSVTLTLKRHGAGWSASSLTLTGRVGSAALRSVPVAALVDRAIEAAGLPASSSLEMVAARYAELVADGRRDCVAVLCRETGLTESSVKTFVSRARRAGLLPPLSRRHR